MTAPGGKFTPGPPAGIIEAPPTRREPCCNLTRLEFDVLSEGKGDRPAESSRNFWGGATLAAVLALPGLIVGLGTCPLGGWVFWFLFAFAVAVGVIAICGIGLTRYFHTASKRDTGRISHADLVERVTKHFASEDERLRQGAPAL